MAAKTSPEEKLVTAALAAIEQSGWKALSLTALARKAKIAPAVLYELCPDKRALLALIAVLISVAALAGSALMIAALGWLLAPILRRRSAQPGPTAPGGPPPITWREAYGILGFLGVGLRPPDPDWGGMIKDTYGWLLGGKVHMALAPAFALSSLVVGFSLLADGLREVSLKD